MGIYHQIDKTETQINKTDTESFPNIELGQFKMIIYMYYTQYTGSTSSYL